MNADIIGGLLYGVIAVDAALDADGEAAVADVVAGRVSAIRGAGIFARIGTASGVTRDA